MKALIFTLVFFVSLAHAQQAISESKNYVCQARQKYNNGGESTSVLKLKVSFNDLRVTKQLKGKWIPFFGEQANCITSDPNSNPLAHCETVRGRGKFNQEVRCENNELQSEYSAQIARYESDTDFVEGLLTCSQYNAIVIWHLESCKPTKY